MFPIGQRLRRSNDILTVFRRGEVARVGGLTVYKLPRADQRVTVIVDKKVSKKAVTRNLLKRRLRAALRAQGLPKGWTIVRGYPGSEKTSYSELTQQLQRCLNHPRLRD